MLANSDQVQRRTGRRAPHMTLETAVAEPRGGIRCVDEDAGRRDVRAVYMWDDARRISAPMVLFCPRNLLSGSGNLPIWAWLTL